MFAGCQHFCRISNGDPLCWLSKLQISTDDPAKNVVVLKIHADPCRLFVLFQMLSSIKLASNVYNYDDAKRTDKPNLWILLLTESFRFRSMLLVYQSYGFLLTYS